MRSFLLCIFLLLATFCYVSAQTSNSTEEELKLVNLKEFSDSDLKLLQQLEEVDSEKHEIEYLTPREERMKQVKEDIDMERLLAARREYGGRLYRYRPSRPIRLIRSEREISDETAEETRKMPKLLVKEYRKSYLVLIPFGKGITKKDVKLNVSDSELTVRVEKRQVRADGSVSIKARERTFPLTRDIDTKRIKADFGFGMLRIYLPKKLQFIREELEYSPYRRERLYGRRHQYRQFSDETADEDEDEDEQ